MRKRMLIVMPGFKYYDMIRAIMMNEFDCGHCGHCIIHPLGICELFGDELLSPLQWPCPRWIARKKRR